MSDPTLERRVAQAPPSHSRTLGTLLGRRKQDAPAQALPKLRSRMAEHPLWNNPLLKACASGHLTREDFRFVFSQYYLYSRAFTRYLSALMVNCENDFFRSRLAENLWEEGGALDPADRHAEIFRAFLRDGLGIDVTAISFESYTQLFAKEYLDTCLRSSPAAASAFLSLGTEAIVPRLYGLFMKGLLEAGVPQEQLIFFKIHMECDDDHAETIEQIMCSYSEEADWHETCTKAMYRALDLRDQFFRDLYDTLMHRRVGTLIDRIQDRKSLASEEAAVGHYLLRPGQAGEPVYANTNEALDIEFTVERVPFQAEVFDTRMVRIPPGKVNERHRHAHESVFYIVEGRGRVSIEDTELEVAAGDVVFVPRWAFHQSRNTGHASLVILAVTDFGLTQKAFIGDYLKTARLKQQELMPSARSAQAGPATVGSESSILTVPPRAEARV